MSAIELSVPPRVELIVGGPFLLFLFNGLHKNMKARHNAARSILDPDHLRLQPHMHPVALIFFTRGAIAERLSSAESMLENCVSLPTGLSRG
jgi:hypothetical protein